MPPLYCYAPAVNMKLFYSDTFELPLPETHRFPMAKYGLLRQRIAESDLDVELLIPPAATDEQLLLAHTHRVCRESQIGKLNQSRTASHRFPLV